VSTRHGQQSRCRRPWLMTDGHAHGYPRAYARDYVRSPPSPIASLITVECPELLRSMLVNHRVSPLSSGDEIRQVVGSNPTRPTFSQVSRLCLPYPVGSEDLLPRKPTGMLRAGAEREGETTAGHGPTRQHLDQSDWAARATSSAAGSATSTARRARWSGPVGRRRRLQPRSRMRFATARARPAGHRGLRHPPGAARVRPGGLRGVPEEAGRRGQGAVAPGYRLRSPAPGRP
jgi:hypothetical protein